MPATQGNGLRAQDSPSAQSYYPPSELAGGWRRCKTDEDVRRLGGMDPEKLASSQVGVGAYFPDVPVEPIVKQAWSGEAGPR